MQGQGAGRFGVWRGQMVRWRWEGEVGDSGEREKDRDRDRETKRDREGGSKPCHASPSKGTNPITRAPPSGPNSLPKGHLQVPSHSKCLGHECGGDTDMWSITQIEKDSVSFPLPRPWKLRRRGVKEREREIDGRLNQLNLHTEGSTK